MSITLERLDVDAHADLLHAWVTHPRSAFWMMQDASPDDVRDAYDEIDRHPHHDAWLGRVDGEPAFLAETYEPRLAPHVGLADVPDLHPGDLGMHVLVAPPDDDPVPGFTRRVFRAVMAHCFADPARRPRRGRARRAQRGDPRRSNAEAGFVVARDRDPARQGRRAVLLHPSRLGGLPRCARSDR